MTLIGTLWGDTHQRRTKVVRHNLLVVSSDRVAALNGFELNQPAFSFQDRPAEFTAKFPYGKIPAFESTDGFKLIEGVPIARYPSAIGTKVNQLGSNANEAATVDQWIHFAEREISAPTYAFSNQIRGLFPFIRESVDTHYERLVRALKHLESHLASRPSGYVALDALTLADLVVASTTHAAARAALGIAERAQYPRIFAHYAKVTEGKEIKQYWGTEGFVNVRPTEPTAV